MGRAVVAVSDRYRIECDGERHWYVDTQGGTSGLGVEPPHVVGPCPGKGGGGGLRLGWPPDP